MEITQAVGDAEKLRTELLVIGIFAGEPLRGAAQAVDHHEWKAIAYRPTW